jgi:hypothetical protein
MMSCKPNLTPTVCCYNQLLQSAGFVTWWRGGGPLPRHDLPSRLPPRVEHLRGLQHLLLALVHSGPAPSIRRKRDHVKGVCGGSNLACMDTRWRVTTWNGGSQGLHCMQRNRTSASFQNARFAGSWMPPSPLLSEHFVLTKCLTCLWYRVITASDSAAGQPHTCVCQQAGGSIKHHHTAPGHAGVSPQWT